MSRPPSRFYYLPHVPLGKKAHRNYTDYMVEIWRQAGFELIEPPGGLKGMLQGIRRRGDVICVANWIDDELTAGGTVRLKNILAYFKLIVKNRLLSRHFVFMRHNVFPHAAQGRSRGLAKWIIELSEATVFNVVFVLSEHMENRYRTCLPHPMYRFEAPPPQSEPSDALVYFGSFAPYKRLDLLIEAWDRPSKLILAGECRSEEVIARHREAARGKNIEFITHRLTDDEAMSLIRSCAGFVIPHSGPDMIASSSLHFGLSCGVPIVAVGSAHARHLASTGFPGLVTLDDLSEINRIDLEALRKTDRAAIDRAARERFGPEVLVGIIHRRLGLPPRPPIDLAELD